MTTKAIEHICIHENRWQQSEATHTELKTEIEHTKTWEAKIDTKLDNINTDIKTVLKEFNDFKLESMKDDNNIDKRITAVESQISTVKGIMGIIIGLATLIIATLTFLLTHLH